MLSEKCETRKTHIDCETIVAKPTPAYGIPLGDKGASNAHQLCRSSPEHNAGKGTHPPLLSVLYDALIRVVKSVLIEIARRISWLLMRWAIQTLAFAKVLLLHELIMQKGIGVLTQQANRALWPQRHCLQRELY